MRKKEINEEVIEVKEEQNKEKNNFFHGVLLSILIIAIVLVVLWQGGLVDFNNNSNSKVDLKYTETTTKIKEGIYVTDVSDIVEDVMPSIVSITSKTLVKSGYFGFDFYGTFSG